MLPNVSHLFHHSLLSDSKRVLPKKIQPKEKTGVEESHQHHHADQWLAFNSGRNQGLCVLLEPLGASFRGGFR